MVGVQSLFADLVDAVELWTRRSDLRSLRRDDLPAAVASDEVGCRWTSNRADLVQSNWADLDRSKLRAASNLSGSLADFQSNCAGDLGTINRSSCWVVMVCSGFSKGTSDLDQSKRADCCDQSNFSLVQSKEGGPIHGLPLLTSAADAATCVAAAGVTCSKHKPFDKHKVFCSLW
jgi:hypothetical protein